MHEKSKFSLQRAHTIILLTCNTLATLLVRALVLVRLTFTPLLEFPRLDMIVGGNIRFWIPKSVTSLEEDTSRLARLGQKFKKS